MNRVVHFEIQAKDQPKLQKFYQDVFGWEITDAGPDFGGYYMVKTGDAMPSSDPATLGINGGMPLRRSEVPAAGMPVNAFVCIIGVDNIDDIIGKIVVAGGKEALAKMDVPHVGTLAYYRDPEENLFGILQPSPSMTPDTK